MANYALHAPSGHTEHSLKALLAAFGVRRPHVEHNEDGRRYEHPGYDVDVCEVCGEPTILSEPRRTCGYWDCLEGSGEPL